MNMPFKFAALVLMCAAPVPAFAQADKFNITLKEHAACDADAYQFCSTSADMDGLLSCMKVHRPDLSQICRSVFEAGLRARHLPI